MQLRLALAQASSWASSDPSTTNGPVLLLQNYFLLAQPQIGLNLHA